MVQRQKKKTRKVKKKLISIRRVLHAEALPSYFLINYVICIIQWRALSQFDLIFAAKIWIPINGLQFTI